MFYFMVLLVCFERCGSAVIESKAIHKRIDERVNGWINKAKTRRSVKRLLQQSSKR